MDLDSVISFKWQNQIWFISTRLQNSFIAIGQIEPGSFPFEYFVCRAITRGCPPEYHFINWTFSSKNICLCTNEGKVIFAAFTGSFLTEMFFFLFVKFSPFYRLFFFSLSLLLSIFGTIFYFFSFSVLYRLYLSLSDCLSVSLYLFPY